MRIDKCGRSKDIPIGCRNLSLFESQIVCIFSDGHLIGFCAVILIGIDCASDGCRTCLTSSHLARRFIDASNTREIA